MAGRDKEAERARRAEVARYLAGIYDLAGYSTQVELATDVGVAPSAISHWLNETGKGRGPSAFNVLQVIEAGERRKAGVSAMKIDEPLARRLESLEATVDETGEDMTKALKGVQSRLRKIEAALGLEAPRARTGTDGQG